MLRQIYIVRASVVDANGSWSELTGYPMTFDSKNYIKNHGEEAVNIARKRAEGEAADVWSDMCKVDNRQVQLVTVTTADGFEVLKYEDGKLAELPDPEPEPEPAPEPTPEPEGE